MDMASTNTSNTTNKPSNKTKQKVTSTRKKFKNKSSTHKLKQISKLNPLDTDETEGDDLILPEDKELLQDIEDDEASDEKESAVDVNPDGKDITSAEIIDFLQTLKFDKHKPFPTSIGVQNDKSKTVRNNEEDSKTIPEKKDSMDKIEKEKKVNSVGKTKAPVSIGSALNYLKTYRSRKYLLLKPGEMWREEKPSQVTDVPDAKLISEAENLAQRLLADEIALYSKKKEATKRSEAHWLKTVLSSGTLTDKMAALTLLVQESPVHNMSSLDSLANMAGKKGRRESMMAVDTLRDLFLTGLLPDDRKLRPFNQHPILELSALTSNNVDHRDRLLLMWHFEATVKKKYSQFIKTLGEMSFDTLQATKEKAVATIHYLLSSKPEQENILLPMLVNKLGDPTIKSKTMYLMTKLVEEHPNMSHIIVREVKQLLHRANISPRAQYYAICYLSQLRLSENKASLASELISIYFYFFQAYLQKGEVDNKMMSALLTGVNRAYVYAKGEKQELSEQMNAVYRIIPQVNFHTGVQALMLLYQVTDNSGSVSDRYYMSLYRKLGDPALKNSSKQAIFMNLIFKSIKRDLVDRRIKAFIKRILQVYSQQPPQVVCGILILLSQILKEKPGLIDFKHIAKGVWVDDDEEEKFVDLPDPDEEEPVLNKEEKENGAGSTEAQEVNPASHGASSSTWVHRVNVGGKGRSSDYDPLCRNPLYCRAEADLVWELQQLTHHYHPSVRLYASNMLSGQKIEYDGDPLKDFTLIRFLDRFVYKNPKKNLENIGGTLSRFKKQGPSGARAIPVNSEDFLKMEEGDVPEEDKFFHRYFLERAKRKKESVDDHSDADSVSDTEFDDYLNNFEKGADLEDFGDLNLDFASDKKSAKTKKGKQEVEESEDSDDFGDDEDDEDLDLGDDELAAEFSQEMEGIARGGDSDDEDDDLDDEMDISGFDGGEEEDELSPDDDDDDELKMMMKKSRKRKNTSSLEPVSDGKKKKKKSNESLFASAEEFAHLLEDDAEQGMVSLGGVDDISNKDKAGMKQLKWEANREHGMHGKKQQRGGPRTKKGKKSVFQQNRGPGKKGNNPKQKSGKFKKSR